jgi:hypothetical protein
MKTYIKLSICSVILFANTVFGIDKELSLNCRPQVMWYDDRTGEVIFDLWDIVRFDWDKQIFELTPQKAMDLMVMRTGLYNKFHISDTNGQLIYKGVFVSPMCSVSFPCPSIVIESPVFKDSAIIKPPLFKIDAGYPSQLDPSIDSELSAINSPLLKIGYPRKLDSGNNRFSGRLKTLLKGAGVLETIYINNTPERIVPISCSFQGDNKILLATAEVFPQTFRIGELSRIHFSIYYVNFSSIDIIDCNIAVKDISGNLIKDGYRITKDDFLCDNPNQRIKTFVILNDFEWISSRNGKYLKPGTAELSIEVIGRKSSCDNLNISQEILKIKSSEMKIDILPKAALLKAQLIADQNEFHLGKPINLKLEMTNVSRVPVRYEISQATLNDRFKIIASDGKTLPYVDTDYQTTGQDVVIRPGKTYTLFENFDLNSQYRIVKPGKYKIEYRFDRLGYNIDSNVLEFKIR